LSLVDLLQKENKTILDDAWGAKNQAVLNVSSVATPPPYRSP